MQTAAVIWMWRVAGLSAGIAVLVAMLALVHERRQLPELTHKAKSFERFCGMVYFSIDVDARDLRDPKRQKAAADRFYVGPFPHGAHEIQMCITRPVNTEEHTMCWLKYDYECLARIADEVKRALPVPGRR